MRKFYYNCIYIQFFSKDAKMAKWIFLHMIKDEMFKLRYAQRTIESYVKWVSSFMHCHQAPK